MFKFNISLSVLDHLGRNLYRNFATVLAEAISNAWDADANNVYINIQDNAFTIFDDGTGMSEDDFQNKFLRVGYSKRTALNSSVSAKRRPFIGRKGIGKLALLSCSEKVTIVSKKVDTDLIGGIIDNTKLDETISDDNDHYQLDDIDPTLYSSFFTEKSSHGTLLSFDKIKPSIPTSVEYIKSILAMSFRFSILGNDDIDTDFHIFVNDEEVTLDDLKDLIDNTEFVWKINGSPNDVFADKLCAKDGVVCENISVALSDSLSVLTGFVATVEKPSQLKIKDTKENVSLDLFVNGRLREKDILRHIKTHRIVESYIYGQINFNSLDDDIDRFTSSRESIKSDDPKFKELLTQLKEQIILHILDRWDILRDERDKDGDPDNPRLAKKNRKAKELFNATIENYKPKEGDTKVKTWVKKLREEAQCNFPSYAECFISENLVRNYIKHKEMSIDQEANNRITRNKESEIANKNAADMSIDIRQSVYGNETEYLAMDDLAKVAEPGRGGAQCVLQKKAKDFKPIRDALMHTAFLTEAAKRRLTTVFDDIEARVNHLLDDVE